MDAFTRDDLKVLLGQREGPCLSIYLPTQRGGDVRGPTRFRHCLAQAEQELIRRGLRGADAGRVLAPARLLLDEASFWKGQADGLAFFLAENLMQRYRLPVTFEERVAVGRHFLVTPLLSFLGGDGRFFVLALSQKGVRLLQGTREAIREMDLPGVPRNMDEALATHDVDEVLTFHTRPAGGAGSWAAIFHGHGVGIDDHKEEVLRYFQIIDRGLHPLLRQEKAPLILAAVEYLHPIFRQACTYPHLVPRGVPGAPEHLSDKQLLERAWPLVEPLLTQKQSRELALYAQLAGTGRTICGSDTVAAAIRGEVEILFVASNRSIWGRVDPLLLHEKPEPGDEDLINLAAIETLRHRGNVHVLRSEQMPAGSLLAGIFWRPHARREREA